MFRCPNCAKPLNRTNVAKGFAWVCSTCKGRAMTLPVLRRLVEPVALRRLWNRTFDAMAPSQHPCPACEQPMLQVRSELPDEAFALDVCRRCALVWFDANEFEAMPAGPVPPFESAAALEARQRQAISEVKERARVAREQAPDLADVRTLPALLGMPLELHGVDRRSAPWGTWCLAVAVAAISIVAFADDELIRRFAFVPDEQWRLGGLTMLTAFFLHGGWWHLLGNLYFFVVFGDDVEDFLGRRRWLLMLVSATLAGSLLHALGAPDSGVPCIGASGGISGLIAFYALRFPHARLGTYLWFLRIPHWITFPAWGAFAFWVLMQLLVLLQQLSGFGNVSALAHLGGAAVGVVAWLVTRDRSPPR